MSKDISKDKCYFDGFDIEGAKKIKHPLIEKAQKQYMQPFDDDVFIWLAAQNEETKKHINNVLREMMTLLNN